MVSAIIGARQLNRYGYVLLITGLALFLLYLGVIQTGGDVVLVVPRVVKMARPGEVTRIEVMAVNIGKKNAALLKAVIWDDFSITAHVPGRRTLQRQTGLTRKVLRHRDEDYGRISPGQTNRIGILLLGEGTPFSEISDWVGNGRNTPVGPLRLDKPGNYHLQLTYEDRDAPNREAISSLDSVVCTVVVE